MIEKTVVKPVYKADLKAIEHAHEFMLNIRNMTAERCFMARELFQSVIDSVTIEEKECIERIRETEEQAKEYFGDEFVQKIESLIQYCNENNLRLRLHGTDEHNLSDILNHGLHCHTNDLSYTSHPLIEDGLYSRLLNWPHREYKGIVMLAIPKECCDWHEDGLLPIWNDHIGSTFYDFYYELSPEFILGALDIKQKSVIMNDTFCCEHDYSKFRLKNNEQDELPVQPDDNHEQDTGYIPQSNDDEWLEDTNPDDGKMLPDTTLDDDEMITTSSKEIVQQPRGSIMLNNPMIRAMHDEEVINPPSVFIPKTYEAEDLVGRLCTILAFFRTYMEQYGYLPAYEKDMKEYRKFVEPFLTDELIHNIQEEMRTHPECFPASAVAKELSKEESVGYDKKSKSDEGEFDDDDWWID